MTKHSNELTIVCNCDDKEQMAMSVHVINGIVPIVVVKCDVCQANYSIIPNSVQDAQLLISLRSMRRGTRDESPGNDTRRQQPIVLQLPNDTRVQRAIDHI